MDRYALVVGIAQYNTKGLVPLEKTTTDAEAVAQVLEQYGNFTEVKRLPYGINPETKKREMVNQPVTKKQLWQAIETLLKEQARNNDALIYFTGHGLRAKGLSGKPRGYLATSDCRIEVDVTKSEGNKDESRRIMEVYGGIPFNDLNDLISESELSSLVVLLDCCHSGDFIERNLITHSLGISLEKDYHLIAACRGFEEGKALKSEAHSVFTGALLGGLRAENASSNGEISCDRLYDHISTELKDRRASQQPLKLGWGTSIILVSYPPAIVPGVVEVPAAQPVVNRDNPYLGLMAFDADKKDYFFGREAAVRGIGERLSKSRFLAVIGASGCGKSSLVKAGVLPKLKCDMIPDSSQWEVKILTPGRYPLEELEHALANREPGKTFLLFIDQFEELFTLGSDESRQREFISKITEEATKIDGDTRVIVALRGDFLDRCAGYPETANLINCTQPTTYVVTPMTAAELTEAIEQPAEKHGITFESGLVEQIIIDVVNQAGALPLLQYALAELWRVCVTDSNQEQTQLTFEGYEQIRGVKGALEKRADELYQNLAEADQKFVRCLFLELVQLGENQEVTRRRASSQYLLDKADSPEQFDRVKRQLANWNQRLIITDENKVEVAHEALLSEWRLLRKWIEDNRDNLRLKRRLEGDCQEWNKKNRLEGLLLTGTWLAAIDDWVKKEPPGLSPLESEFLRESLGRRDRENQEKIEAAKREAEARAKAAEAFSQAQLAKAEAKAKIQKQRNWLLSTAVVALAIIAVLSVGIQQKTEQQNKAIFEALIAKPKQLIKNNNQLEALVETVKIIKQLKALEGNSLSAIASIKYIVKEVKERNRLEGHKTDILHVEFSLDGQLIASASADNTVKLWRENGKLLKTFNSHEDDVWGVSISQDNKNIASASADGTVSIWGVQGNNLNHKLKPLKIYKEKDAVLDVNFSPNGQMLASAHWDNCVRLWRVSDGKLLNTLRGHNDAIYGVSFSPDGQKVASASWDKTIKVWDVARGQMLKTFKGHTAQVNNVSFSPDGQKIASASKDKTIKLWNVATGKVLKTFVGHNDFVYEATFSFDGQKIASASKDKTIRLWDVATGKLLEIIAGHQGEVNSVKFSPNNQIIISASDDRTIRLWSVNSGIDNNGLELDSVLVNSCHWLYNYLKYNSQLTPDERRLCDDI